MLHVIKRRRKLVYSHYCSFVRNAFLFNGYALYIKEHVEQFVYSNERYCIKVCSRTRDENREAGEIIPGIFVCSYAFCLQRRKRRRLLKYSPSCQLFEEILRRVPFWKTELDKTYLPLNQLVWRNFKLFDLPIHSCPDDDALVLLIHHDTRNGKRAILCASMPHHQILGVKQFLWSLL